ncbi:MAG: DUF4388 domain-containing protein [Nitrospirae bacterium]|nr:DUF4388 domain-containing protein [Nitrospirota bacterium]
MALEGSLKDFGLADILQLIFFQRKTGVLTIEGKMDRVRLLFAEGNIVGAESKRRMEDNRLGKVLTKKGLLEEKDLQAVLDEQRRSNVKLGNILVRKGLVKKEDIEEILKGQIKETVIQIFGWKEGTYEFTPQAVPVDKDIQLFIDTQHLLMEGLRILDEWSLIEGKITLDTVFIKKTEEVEALKDEEKDIFSLVDGENDVSTIIDITGKDDFTVSKTLVSLMEKGVIELKEDLSVVAEAPLIEKKKPGIGLNILPVLIIFIALIVSFSTVFLHSNDIFKRFSASKAVDDLRLKIEAHRFEYGSYPESLDLISDKTDPWGNPYVYEQNDYAFIVLSKGADGRKGTSDDIF